MLPATLRSALAGAVFLAALGAARADDAAPVTPERQVYCTVCHGVQMMGNRTLQAPRLSGMSRWYVASQLRAFRDGRRGAHPDDPAGREMQAMAAGLSDPDIAAASEYIGETVSPRPHKTVDGDAAHGATLYETCAACHGVDGGGDETLGAPALTGQNDWYLERQLANFVAGYRGYEADDLRGQQMRAAVAPLGGDDDIRAVVAYIQTLNSD